MKVVQVHSSDGGGGAEAVVRLHHAELQRQGHTSQLLVGRKSSSDAQTMQIPFCRGPKGILRTTRWLERKTGLQNLYSPSFRNLEASFPFTPDVLHLHSLHGIDGFAELEVLRKLGHRYPVVISLHDLWLMTGHCGHPLDCARWKSGCGRCPDLTLYPSVSRDATAWNFSRKKRLFRTCRLHLIVPSEWLRQQVMDSPILGHLPVTVVANPVDTATFAPADATSCRHRFGIGSADPTVLMVAQHLSNPYKGIQDGIDTLNQLSVPGLRVILVGRNTDDAASQIRHPVVELPFTTEVDRLAEYYRMADVLLMPSRGETFGLVAAEAMACGTPVVAAAVGGLVDVIGDNEGGLLAKPRDCAAMAAALERLLADAPLRQQLGEQGRKRAVARFDSEIHTTNCLAVYESAIRSRMPAGRKVPV